uniref:Uncharacterized protein n=1 Tax=viral metagenome TaxID=1070528 RepID=A0A6M3KPM6_9ZZZZ
MAGSAVIILQDVVDNVKAKLRKFSDEEDVLIKQYAISAIRELNLYHGETFIKGTFVLNPDLMTVPLPEDYIKYITEPYVCYSGKKWTLTRDRSLCIPDTQECAEDINPNAANTERKYWGFHYGQTGGKNVAYYEIDKTNRVVIIRGNIPDNTFYMDYISIDLGINGNAYIPAEALKMLIAHVIWEYYEDDESVPSSLKERKRQLYVLAAHKYHSLKSLTINELLDIIRKGYKQTIKR